MAAPNVAPATPLNLRSTKPRTRLKVVPSAAPRPQRGRALLEDHLDLIQRKLHHLSWRSRLPELDAEEFRSWALLKLVESRR